MVVRKALVAAGLTCALVPALVHAQGFGMRLGRWQYVVTMSGGMDLSKLPPAARAQAEAAMKQSHTVTSCVTAEDLKAMQIGGSDDDDEDCKVTSQKITATTADMTRVCTGDSPRTETMHAELSTKEAVRMTINSTGGDRPGQILMVGKWIGADCKKDE